MFDWGVRVSWEVRDDGKGEVSSAVLQVLLVCQGIVANYIVYFCSWCNF